MSTISGGAAAMPTTPSPSPFPAAQSLCDRASRLLQTGSAGEVHCSCDPSTTHYNPARHGGACGCLTAACETPSSCGLPRDGLALALAALRVCDGQLANAFVVVARALSDEPDDVVEASRLPDSCRAALVGKPANREALCLAALSVDAGCADAYEYLSLICARGNKPFIQIKPNLKLSAAELSREANRLLALDFKRRMSPAAAEKPAVAGPSPVVGGSRVGVAGVVGAAPAVQLTGAQRTVKTALGKLKAVNSEFFSQKLADVANDTATQAWLEASWRSLPAPKSDGADCSLLNTVVDLLQPMTADDGPKKNGRAQVAAAAREVDGFSRRVDPDLPFAAQLYRCLALLDLDVPRETQVVEKRSYLPCFPAAYLSDARTCLAAYRDAVCDSPRRAPFDAVYFLAAAAIELQSGSKSMPAVNGFLDAYGALMSGADAVLSGSPRKWHALFTSICGSVLIVEKEEEEKQGAIADFEMIKKELSTRWSKREAAAKPTGASSPPQKPPPHFLSVEPKDALTGIEKLFGKVGLEDVKLEAMALVRSALATADGFHADQPFLNFRFVGNPGE